MARLFTSVLAGLVLVVGVARADGPSAARTPLAPPDPHLHAEPWRPSTVTRVVGHGELMGALEDALRTCAVGSDLPGSVTVYARANDKVRASFDESVPEPARACIEREVVGWLYTGPGEAVSIRNARRARP